MKHREAERSGGSGWRMLVQGRRLVIGAPYLWLLLFFLLPFLIVLRISFADMDGATISSLVSYVDQQLVMKLQLGNYATIFQDDIYLSAYGRSLMYAGITTLRSSLIAGPPPASEFRMAA